MKEVLVFKQYPCAPCVMAQEFMEEKGLVADKVYNLSSGESEALMKAGIHGVLKTPTFIVLENGSEIYRYQGAGRGNITKVFEQAK